MQDNYRELTTHTVQGQGDKPRKPRVHWTALEWEKVVSEYLRREAAGEFETGRQYDIAGKIRLCQDVLPENRRCNASRFYHANFKNEAQHHLQSARDRLAAKRDLQAHQQRGERNTPQIVADIEAKIAGLEDMADEVVRELNVVRGMQAEILASQTRMLEMLSILVGEPPAPAPAEPPAPAPVVPAQGAMQATESGNDGAGLRIDVIGLLDTQAERLRRALAGKVNCNLRFIRGENFGTVHKFAPDVVLCTDFAPKGSQGALRAAGCKILFVHGNVSAVVRAMVSKYGQAE